MPASKWCRLWAILIDEALMFIGLVAGISVTVVIFGFDLEDSNMTLATLLLCVGSIWLYRALFESQLGATPGKLLLRICVLRRDGTRIGFLRATLRHAARIIPLDSLYLLISADSRAVHDLVADTIVVLRGDVPAGVLED